MNNESRIIGSVDRVLHNSLFIIHYSRKSVGFTLMELLVALALFSITTGIVTNLFLLASRRQARTTTAVRVQGDARLIIESITRELREGTIAYDDTFKSYALAITNPNEAVGNVVFFDRVTTGCSSGSTSCVEIGRREDTNADLEKASLTSSGVSVESFDVLIAPDRDPFTWIEGEKRYASNAQPRATIHLVLTAPTGKAGDVIRIEAQTTIASRAYRR